MREADRNDEIRALREFNRAYTSRLGLLNANFDESPFTLSEGRILYEIGHGSPIAADIGRTLRVDRAQLSRTVKRFKDKGLVESRPADGRSRSLAFTSAGQAALNALERNTNQAIGSLLEELSPEDRRRLLAAAHTIKDIFESRPGLACCLREFRIGDVGWVVHRQAILYHEEYGWDIQYEGLIAGILGEFIRSFDPQREGGWIAEVDQKPIGSIFLVSGDEPPVGKLRLLYVEPEARGRGAGKMLVDACVQRAKELGYERLVLWTNDVLVSARRLYERAGFTLEKEEKHHSFGHDLVGQYWSLDLR
jgi:DNA-binding MarR family transcriptional regulator/GNAT superfamily N-acetyltransferase